MECTLLSEITRRANVTETIKMSLLCEVKGSCPLCRRKLISKTNKKTVRVFDVAHIYPLNATPREVDLLKNEERLCDDIDSEGNLIALCKECHKIYDTHKTKEEYRQLVKIKKEINDSRKLEELWDRQTLHKDIAIVADKIGSMDEVDCQLSYSALKTSQKTDHTFGRINEIKVNNFVINYYTPIRNTLKELERQNKAKTTFICSQIRSYYAVVLMQGLDQSSIFEKLTEWFMTNTGITERPKAEVLVSYFIQNCEIFSEC